MSEATPPGPAPSPPPVVRRRGERGRIYTVIGVIAVAAILVGVGAGTSWYGLKTSTSSSACPAGVILYGEGAAFPYAMLSVWASEFQTATSDMVSYNPSNAGQGIADLISKSLDFAVTDEGVNASQNTSLIGAVGTYLTLPIIGGPVAIVYNIPGLSRSLPPLNLSATQLAMIYMGDITWWNDTRLSANNSDLANIHEQIYSVHRADTAGMTYVLTQLFSEQDKTWRTTPGLGTSLLPAWPKVTSGATKLSLGGNKNSGELLDVQETSYSIGYTDLYDAQSRNLAVAAIQNSHYAYIPPTVANTTSAIEDVYTANYSGPGQLPSATGNWANVTFVNASGAGDYPLAALSYLIVPLDLGKLIVAGSAVSPSEAIVVREWIDWVATQGQVFNRTYFPFISPPAPLLSLDLSALPEMTLNGAPIPSCT